MRLMDYKEEKPHYVKLVLWRLVNAVLFRIVNNGWRQSLLRLFGAKLKGGLVYCTVKVYAPWNLEVGHWTVLGPRVEIYNKAKVRLGDNVIISQDAFICTASHDITSDRMDLVTKPITISSSAWVCAKTIVLPGVGIGEGAVVAAGAVVAKDVEPWTVVGGNPAKVIKKRIPKEM